MQQMQCASYIWHVPVSVCVLKWDYLNSQRKTSQHPPNRWWSKYKEYIHITFLYPDLLVHWKLSSQTVAMSLWVSIYLNVLLLGLLPHFLETCHIKFNLWCSTLSNSLEVTNFNLVTRLFLLTIMDDAHKTHRMKLYLLTRVYYWYRNGTMPSNCTPKGDSKEQLFSLLIQVSNRWFDCYAALIMITLVHHNCFIILWLIQCGLHINVDSLLVWMSAILK